VETTRTSQAKQDEWHDQWSMLQDDELFLFKDWIAPLTLEDFRGKTVLECGCGGGQHTSFVAPFAKEVTAVDLNTVDIARLRNRENSNVAFVEADIATMDLGRQFDIVFSIGVVHHTDDPNRTAANLRRHVKPGGKLVLWVYSLEGNSLVAHLVEPFRKRFLRSMDRTHLLTLSRAICAAIYPPVYTVYRLPVRQLPYYEYFGNFRRLSFDRNTLNIFDKLNAPQVDLIARSRIEGWFSGMDDVSIRPYKGVSWTGVGTAS
jgi:SAM-dependent methyltransferase